MLVIHKFLQFRCGGRSDPGRRLFWWAGAVSITQQPAAANRKAMPCDEHACLKSSLTLLIEVIAKDMTRTTA